MKVLIQHGGATTALEVSLEDDTVADMATRMQAATDVPKHTMKFIFRGRVMDQHVKLSQFALKEGSKLMMLASGTPSKGQQMLDAVTRQRAESAAARREEFIGSQRAPSAAPLAPAPTPVDRLRQWRATGIVALRGLGLSALPQGLSDLGASVYAVDAGNNELAELADVFIGMQGLQKLRCSHNRLVEGGVPWTTLSLLPALEQLLLDHNRLAAVGPTLCGATSLRALDLSHNRLTALPPELGALVRLETLDVSHNALTELPESIGDCVQLQTLDASHNRLRALPATLGRLARLQVLTLASNRIDRVQQEVLEGAKALHSLTLSDNPVTMQQLREVPGFDAYQDRRKGRLDKIVEMKVGADFDEGIDYEKFHRHLD